jgi:endonuclease YncB( thermonuclease family)
MRSLPLLACVLLASSAWGQDCGTPVLRVIDGDTFVISTLTIYSVEPYKAMTELPSVRLLRVDTPEKGQPGFQEARTYLTTLVAGKLVGLAPRGRDSFGRILAEVFLCELKPPSGNVNDLLRAKGWADTKKR